MTPFYPGPGLRGLEEGAAAEPVLDDTLLVYRRRSSSINMILSDPVVFLYGCIPYYHTPAASGC